jgi:hypothetical protein
MADQWLCQIGSIDFGESICERPDPNRLSLGRFALGLSFGLRRSGGCFVDRMAALAAK